MMTTSASLGADIRQAREALKLSAGELARKASVSRLTLRELETGTGNPRLSTLLAVCHVLELDLAVLPRGLAPMVNSDQNLRSGSLKRLLGGKRGTHEE
ncbi:helix-turn-helix transcriptional regulator [Paraburkholderia sp. SIMBA_054]|uniref:helix-turn-helix transcriptional regulator n=1 Tax=Paraburkholderia sp. SIMBA_054 TaxID=3085795 RepID=UPI00397A2F2A